MTHMILIGKDREELRCEIIRKWSYFDPKRDHHEIVNDINQASDFIEVPWSIIYGDDEYIVRERFCPAHDQYTDSGIYNHQAYVLGRNNLFRMEKISWEKEYGRHEKTYHRNDGPALISFNKNGKISKIGYWVNGVDISHDVRDWMRDMSVPHFYQWTDDHRILFKMTFG